MAANLNIGTYIDTSPSNIFGTSRDSRGELQSGVNRDLELIFRKMYIHGWIHLDIYNPLIADLPRNITNLSGMHAEMNRIVNILDVPSCTITVNYRYKIWKNVCAIIIYYLSKQIRFINNSHGNMIGKTITSIRDMTARDEIDNTSFIINLTDIQIVKKVMDILSICKSIERPYLRDMSPVRRFK